MKPGVIDISNDSEFRQLVLENDKPAIVEFSTEWCGASHLHAPMIREMAESFAGRVSFFHIDADRNKHLTSQFGIHQIPTVLLFNEGRPLDQAAGPILQTELSDKIHALLGWDGEPEPAVRAPAALTGREQRIARILVPVDFSMCSQQAVEYAVQLAAACGASVTLLHVVSPGDGILAREREEKMHLLSAVAAALYFPESLPSRYARQTSGGKIESRIIESARISEAILTLSRAGGYDLIISGTHGRSGVNRLINGSIARHIVRHSGKPVLTMQAGWNDTRPGKILVPVDFSRYSLDAIEWSTAPCWGESPEIHFLHVVDTEIHQDHYLFNRESFLSVHPDYTDRMYKKLYDFCGRRGDTITHSIKEGHPGPMIRDYAEKHDIGLIIMSVRGLNRFEHFILGSTTEYIVQTAPCPVLSVGRFPAGGQGRK
ncbi:universal stress protein [bacterium]|nr:universal stress protein [bacterium]